MGLGGTDLNLIKVLDALLREGSTVRAGARLGLSQPAVSAALSRLRQTLGDPLFVRRGRGLEATDHARSLAPTVARLMQEIEGLLEARASFDPAPERRVFRIAGSDFLAPTLLPRLETRLAREAPGITVQLLDPPRVATDALEPGQADLFLARDVDMADWVLKRDLIRASLVVCARKGHPDLAAAGLRAGQQVPLDLYCRLRHLLYSPDGALTQLADPLLARMGRARSVALTVPGFSAAVSVIAQSDLVALLPVPLVASLADRRIRTYRPAFEVPPLRLQMAWPVRADGSPSQRWLRELVREIMAALPARVPGAA